MIIHDYDDKTQPIVTLEHFHGPQKHLADKCLIVFSRVLHAHLLETRVCEKLGEIHACNGGIDILCFTHEGEKLAFYLSPIGAAAAAEACLDAHWQTGATKFVMFGSCGSLDEEQTRGKYIIPTQSYRGEGCSYYYAPPADYLPIPTADRLAAIFDELGAPYVRGRVWTTDSMLRETAGLVRRRKSEGCLAVEMELAGVAAACGFWKLELYDFLEAGDVLAESGYDVTGLHGANHDLGKLRLALEIAKRI